jgi:polyferredoxin
MWVLYVFLAAFVVFRRPFCRGFCPIGALFALLNKTSLLQLRVKEDACKGCNLCEKHCPGDNKVYCNPTAQDCVRCLECIAHCKRGATEIGLIAPKAREGYWE